MSPNNPYDSIRDMLDKAREAATIYEGLPRYQATLAGDLFGEAMPNESLIIRMMLLGEAARRIPPEFRERHPKIPWTLIVNFRNLLIHEYNRINIEKMHKIIREDIPILIPQLEAILADEPD